MVCSRDCFSYHRAVGVWRWWNDPCDHQQSGSHRSNSLFMSLIILHFWKTMEDLWICSNQSVLHAFYCSIKLMFPKPPRSNCCQVGFTTDPVDDRSTMYTSDVGTLLHDFRRIGSHLLDNISGVYIIESAFAHDTMSQITTPGFGIAMPKDSLWSSVSARLNSSQQGPIKALVHFAQTVPLFEWTDFEDASQIGMLHW